jgi:hypothetical protein
VTKRVEEIRSELCQRLMLANGWSQEDLDSRALEAALAAADRGDYRHASSLATKAASTCAGSPKSSSRVRKRSASRPRASPEPR